MNCPYCSSTQVKKLSLVYAQGTSNTVSVSKYGGRFSQHSTKLAQSAAPPARPWTLITLIVFVVLAVVTSGFIKGLINSLLAQYSIDSQIQFYLTRYPEQIGFVFGCTIFLIGIFVARSRYKKYQARVDAYERQWMCQRCGSVLVQN